MKSGQGEEGESGAGEAAVGNALSVGARIRARRKKIGMKQATLAQEAGISAAQLCHIEKSGMRPSLRTLEKIAGALNVTLGTLLESGNQEEISSGPNWPIAGDALASDALARGGHGQGSVVGAKGINSSARPAMHPLGGGSSKPGVPSLPVPDGPDVAWRPDPEASGTIEPVTALWRIHDARDMAVDRRVRARLKREIDKRKKLERDAGVMLRRTLPLDFPAMAEHGVLLAREVRNAAGIGPSAIIDWPSLLETKGIRILETKLPSGTDSWSLWDPDDDTAFVFLRSTATQERKRFRLAYELGHIARYVSGGFRPLRDIGTSKKLSSAFAAALSVPEEAARESAYALDVGPNDWTWELLLFEKARFGISAETFLYRISELGMISTSLFKSLRAKLKAHYTQSRATGGGFEPRLGAESVSAKAGLAMRARVAANRKK